MRELTELFCGNCGAVYDVCLGYGMFHRTAGVNVCSTYCLSEIERKYCKSIADYVKHLNTKEAQPT